MHSGHEYQTFDLLSSLWWVWEWHCVAIAPAPEENTRVTARCDVVFQEMYQHVLRRKHKTQANPWQANYSGLTPLALAAKLGRQDMFQLSLELTCQVGQQTNG